MLPVRVSAAGDTILISTNNIIIMGRVPPGSFVTEPLTLDSAQAEALLSRRATAPSPFRLYGTWRQGTPALARHVSPFQITIHMTSFGFQGGVHKLSSFISAQSIENKSI
jgi:hypothetical protein